MAYKWLTDIAARLLNNHYVKKGETIEDRFRVTCKFVSLGDKDLEKRLYSYIENGWFMFASPILSNAVKEGEKVKALPISCYVNYVEDSIKGLNNHTVETRNLAVKGGGVGGHWSDIRGIDNITPGPIGFLHTIDADMTAYKQGATRRGSYAAYLDINHPDILEFILMRVPNGDLNRKNLNLHHGVNITDDFIEAVLNDKDFNLISPHTKEVIKTVSARMLWETIIETRFRTGEPYIHYIDESNRRLNFKQKTNNLKIRGSNLCSEITLPTDIDRTGVCCLSSLNLATYDEWKDTNIVEDLIRMLDNILTIFIDNAPKELNNAIRGASEERPLGLGAMGFHDYLTGKNIPIDSPLAISINRSIFKHIKHRAINETEQLGMERGPCKYCVTGRRNTVLLSIAPNANSSIILNVSPSIEPRLSNAYTQKTRVGSFLVKNPYLDKLIKEKFSNQYEQVWRDIVANEGSLIGLDIFSDNEKNLFKTAYEIDQRKIVDLAKSRMEFICQSQSVNLFFPNGTDKEYYNNVTLRAFRKLADGFRPLKSLYYLRTESNKKTEKLALSVQRNILDDSIAGDTCINCEG